MITPNHLHVLNMPSITDYYQHLVDLEKAGREEVYAGFLADLTEQEKADFLKWKELNATETPTT